MNKRAGLLGTALPAIVMLAACGGSAAPPSAANRAAPPSPKASSAAAGASGLIKVAAAYSQPGAGFGVLYVAKDQGFFSKNGLDVTLNRVGGTAQIPSLVSNEIQFGTGGNEVINVDVGGGDVVLIAACADFPLFSLYANKQYKTVQDLAGQTIGVTSAGSSTDTAAQLFLKHYNMLGKVKIAPAGGTIASILAAMSKQVIAGGILSPPTTADAERQGFIELVNGVKLGEPLLTSGITVTRTYLKDHQDTVKRFLKAYAEAWTYSAQPANKSAVLKVLEKYTKTDEQAATVAYDAMIPVWQGSKLPTVDPRALASLLALSADPKAQNAKPESFIDNAVLQAAVK